MQSRFHYPLLQLFAFVVIYIINAASYSLISPESLTQFGSQIKFIIQALLVVALSHFVIRLGYKKISARLGSKNQPLLVILLLALVSGIALYQSQKVVTTFFSPSADGERIKVETLEGKQRPFVEKEEQYLLTIISYWAIFSLWGFCYLAITNSRDKKQLKQQLQAQQLKSLMNQLNPHFLFNAMNTIRGMIYEDQDKAADLVTQLSELFRYNLSSGVKVSTSLQDELEICRSYLAIEQFRLGDRLQVNMEISEDTLSAQLPGMALITLVENAVKHGIAPLPEGGELKIISTREQQQVLLSISNPYQTDNKAPGTGTGLSNLAKRLTLMFGPQAQLEQSSLNNHYLINLRFPL
ncbi:histidine kinase [Thalassomonas viridans]|uniref:Histidine kinase n=1 Tax=Thalassomonas viridans TaxID=137584 RepID=A0AAF0CBJ1_9GAMM|nr:histidine kinase [Thalassomonas viridans]WDE06689.1 histidine kinase [Thalassomonas viridans]